MRTTLLAVLLAACAAPAQTPAPEVPPTPPPRWPEEGSVLTVLEAPTAARALTVYLDPGHGVGTNSGNASCLCIDEQDLNLRVATHLAASLVGAAHHVAVARSSNDGPSYDARLQAAREVNADLLLSLHSDARGEARRWSPAEGKSCEWNDANPGFAVLWSDEGDDELVAARHGLALALAARLAEAGFLPYPGAEYAGIYEGEPAHPGVFLDRHEPRKRIKMLRRPVMPSVIIETHQAWDRREEPRWQEEATLQAFDGAVTAALADWGAGG